MQSDAHERARFLIDEARVAGISAEDREWSRSHAEECAECVRYEETTERIVRALSGFAFAAEPPGRVLAGARRQPLRRWALAAAALVVLAAAPVYQSMRDARRDKADALLLDDVQNRVSRAVPLAMEPLLRPSLGEPR